MRHRRAPSYLALLLAAAPACVPPRAPWPAPTLPLSRHVALPEPPDDRGDLAASLGGISTLDQRILPCGARLVIAARPDSMIGTVALIGAGGAFGDGASIDDDLLLPPIVNRALDATATLDEHGLNILASVPATAVVERAGAMLAAATQLDPDASMLQREIDAEADRRRAAHLTRSWEPRWMLNARVLGVHDPRTLTVDASRSLLAPPMERLRSRIATLLRPARLVVVVVGPVDADAIEARLREATSSLPSTDPEPFGAPEARAAWSAPSPQLVTHPTRARDDTSDLRGLVVGPHRDAPEYPAFLVAIRVLGGMHSSRLTSLLRESMAASYGVQTHVRSRAGYSLAELSLDIRRERVDVALATLFGELERLGREDGVDADELARARSLEVAIQAEALEEGGGLAWALLLSVTSGRAPGDGLDLPSRIAAVTSQDLVAVAQRWLRPEQIALSLAADSAWCEGHTFHVPGGAARAVPR